MRARMLAASLLAAALLLAGCAASASNDLDRYVARSVATRPVSGDQGIEVLVRTSHAIDESLRISAINLANAKTIGYKRSRIAFSGDGDFSIQPDFEQGSPTSTGRPLDISIQGLGFLAIELPSTTGDRIGYTRNGNLYRNRNGDLIFGFGDRHQHFPGDGLHLIPQINVPPSVPEEFIRIGQDGLVEYTVPGSPTKTVAGRIQLTQFPNPQSLKRLDTNIFLKTDLSGEPLTGNPGDNGTGTIMYMFLEESNVDIQREELGRIAAMKWQQAIDRAIARIK